MGIFEVGDGITKLKDMSNEVSLLVSKLTNAVEEASVLEVNELSANALGRFDDRFKSDALGVKTILQAKISQIDAFIESSERLTWIDFSESKDAFLIEIQRLIDALGKYHAVNMNRLSLLNVVGKKLPGTKKLKIDYRNALDDLLETIHDLNLVFFILPNDPEMQAISFKISQYLNAKT